MTENIFLAYFVNYATQNYKNTSVSEHMQIANCGWKCRNCGNEKLSNHKK